MNIWGVSAGGHDASLAILKNNELVFASQTERFSRHKNDKYLNKDIINYGFSYGYPDVIMWYEKPHKRFLRKLIYDREFKYFNPKKYLNKLGLYSKIYFCNHHDSHAAASLYTYGGNAENSLIFVFDAVGEFDCISSYRVINNKLSVIDKVKYPNSLGLFYTCITDLLGFKANEDEYIIMGMASYGDAERYYSKLSDIFFKEELNLNFYLNRGCRGIFSEKELDLYKFDIAAATQKIYEDKLISYIKRVLYENKASKIMLGGGCSLNCTANSKILNLVNDIHIFPHPGDGGASVGSALLYKQNKIDFKNAFLGYKESSILNVSSMIKAISQEGFCFSINEKAEFGPRALGNRSILADPRARGMQNKINDLKGRELFRPFAPCILKEYFSEYFDTLGLTESPYMQYTFKCKKPDLIPATVHIDGTSRVQTVDKNNPLLYKLLKEWYKQTGCPALLNTSLNVKGKPLLNSRYDLREFDIN